MTCGERGVLRMYNWGWVTKTRGYVKVWGMRMWRQEAAKKERVNCIYLKSRKTCEWRSELSHLRLAWPPRNASLDVFASFGFPITYGFTVQLVGALAVFWLFAGSRPFTCHSLLHLSRSNRSKIGKTNSHPVWNFPYKKRDLEVFTKRPFSNRTKFQPYHFLGNAHSPV